MNLGLSYKKEKAYARKSSVVLCRIDVEDANVGEGLIVEGTMSGIDGIDLLAKLIKQDSLGVATKIDGSCFIRKDTCQNEKEEIELEAILGEIFNTKDDNHSDDLKELDIRDEKGGKNKRILSS